MTATLAPNETPVIHQLRGREAVNAALHDLADRCNALVPWKRAFLKETIITKPELSVDTISFLVLMLEDSDDDGNITNPALQQIIDEASANHREQP